MDESVAAATGRELKANKKQGKTNGPGWESVAAATGRELKAGKKQSKTQGPGWAKVWSQQLGES